MDNKAKIYRGVMINCATGEGWIRHTIQSNVEGEIHTFHCSVAQAKRLIDKALTSDRITIENGCMMFPTTHDYFAIHEGDQPMPTAEQVARMEQVFARIAK